MASRTYKICFGSEQKEEIIPLCFQYRPHAIASFYRFDAVRTRSRIIRVSWTSSYGKIRTHTYKVCGDIENCKLYNLNYKSYNRIIKAGIIFRFIRLYKFYNIFHNIS